ncbi:alkaline phosphatase [Microbacterium sp. MYb64]|uniref:alkaline phosphatase n=1 Tax=Microbacterium sp. MYb64 TaxID=1848691 RepID=UPI000CFC7D37|nr:alkaline phosphatase [Microbacterium sp. MYb64]PRB07578.1 alkaline phosphatase [Microbacterium sp. MYb64]
MNARTTFARSAIALTLVAGAALAAPAAFAAGPSDPSVPGGATRNDGDQTAALRDAIVAGPAKNVILLIGDGMGDSEITVARDYQYGAGGRLPGIDALPLTGSYTTYSLNKDGSADYVPDSAATGSAWATGTKTYDGAISVDIAGKGHDTLLELAKANGRKTGNVSTAELQDATPAVQAAHVAGRKCYGPDSAKQCGADLLENGGKGSISEQILDTRADVTLGGGSESFEQTAKAGAWPGATLFQQAATRGYQVARTAADLAAISTADQAGPVLGTFSAGNFPTRFAETTATVGGADAPPVTCTESADRLDSSLSLASLTQKSIDLLKGDKGFFLQVEGASIDKQDHAANACGQIGETIDLDEAVQVALDFAKADGNTLVIVTADHAHTSQIVDSTPPTSLSIALKTTEGSTMKVSYGTAGAGGSQQHTGSQVRIAGYGPGAANVVGLTDQTDNFFTIAGALQLNRDLPALSAGATLTVPEKVAPGGTIALAAAGLNGDRQVNGSVSAAGAAARAAAETVGRTDVIDGGVGLSLTAPTEPGEYTVALTGEQTGKALTATFTVAEGAPTTPTASPSPTAPAVALPPTDGNGGSLALTGGTVGAAALVALALIAAGLLLARARARARRA